VVRNGVGKDLAFDISQRGNSLSWTVQLAILTFPEPPTPQARGASLSQALASSSRSDEASGRASARVGCHRTARDPHTMLIAPLALQLTRITDVCKGSSRGMAVASSARQKYLTYLT